MACDAILNIYINVADGLVVYPKVIAKRIEGELPFMASENILMDAVKKGGDRQELHEKIRVYAQSAAKRVKEEGLENNLIDQIVADPAFMVTKEEVLAVLKAENYTGRSAGQVTEFLQEKIRPILEENKDLLGQKVTLNV